MDTASNTEEMIRQITSIPDEVGVRSCFGAPIERNGRTVIPVSRVQFGFGLGFGRGAGSDGGDSLDGSGGGGEGEGGGGGGGGGATPVAIVEITDSGVVVQPIKDETRLSLGFLTAVGWCVFWGGLTLRTIAHEREKTRRTELQHKD